MNLEGLETALAFTLNERESSLKTLNEGLT